MWILDAFDWLRWILDAFDWLAHAIGQLYLAQPLTEVDFRTLKVRHPFMMHVTPLGKPPLSYVSCFNNRLRLGVAQFSNLCMLLLPDWISLEI